MPPLKLNATALGVFIADLFAVREGADVENPEMALIGLGMLA